MVPCVCYSTVYRYVCNVLDCPTIGEGHLIGVKRLVFYVITLQIRNHSVQLYF